MTTFGSVVQLVRTLACHARGRGFEPLSGRHAVIAQSAEHFLGKEEVTSSNLVNSSIVATDFFRGDFLFVLIRKDCKMTKPFCLNEKDLLEF